MEENEIIHLRLVENCEDGRVLDVYADEAMWETLEDMRFHGEILQYTVEVWDYPKNAKLTSWDVIEEYFSYLGK